MIEQYNLSFKKDVRDHLIQTSLRLVVKIIGGDNLTHNPTPQTPLHAESHSTYNFSDYFSRTSIIVPYYLYFSPMTTSSQHPASQTNGVFMCLLPNAMFFLPSKAVSSALSHTHSLDCFSFFFFLKRMVTYLHACYKCSYQLQNQNTQTMEFRNLLFKQRALVTVSSLKFQNQLIY